MSEIEAASKAAQAVAETAGKGIDASRDLGGFFSRILGPGFQILGGAFSDWAHVYRYENALDLRDRVEEIHRQRGITEAIPIAPRLGYQFSITPLWRTIHP